MSKNKTKTTKKGSKDVEEVRITSRVEI